MMTTTEILTGIKNWVTGKLTLKQDVINDLASIRSGAQAGATSVQPADILSYFDNAVYDSGTHRINFYHGQSVIAYIDASPFIIDGMVDDVRIENGYLVIDFNTASGKQDISIPLTDIFNPNNYYTKSETDSQLTQKQTEIDDLYARIGYYVCSTEGNVAAKTIVANNYTLGNGGSIKIKMTNANTVNNATLNINSTGAKALYYDGERASAKNSWEAGETVEVYYDGTSFYANNVAGGSGSGDGAFDVSAKYPTSGVDGGNTYTLEGALAVLNANLSASKKKGGMSIKFIHSYDNKYIRYNLIADEFTTDTTQWAVDDGGVYVENPEFVYVKTDAEGKILWAIKIDGGIYYGAGCPQQVIDYINEKIEELSLDEYEDIVTFLGDLIEGDKTLQELLATKVDKEEDKSLIPTQYIQEIENLEFVAAKIDNTDKLLEGTKSDGTKVFGGDVEVGGKVSSQEVSSKRILLKGIELSPASTVDVTNIIEDPENRIEIKTDNKENIISYRDKEGILHENAGIETNSLQLTEEGMTEFQQALKDAGFNPGGAGNYTDSSYMQIPLPKLAYVNITAPSGAAIWPTSKSDRPDYNPGVNADLHYYMEFYDNAGNFFKKEIIFSAQGNSSMAFIKKNGAADFCNNNGWDDDDTFVMRFGDWVPQDSFHFKAFYTDFLRGSAEVAYQLADEVYKTRGIYEDRPWKKALIDFTKITSVAPANLSEDGTDDMSLQIDNGARCMPDGFPAIFYLNGEFYGIYVWSIKKHRDNYHMNKKNYSEVHLDGTLNADFWNGTINWTNFEVRNPKTLYCMDGSKYDGDYPQELIDSSSEYYNPNNKDHKNTAKTKQYIIDLSTRMAELNEPVIVEAPRPEYPTAELGAFKGNYSVDKTFTRWEWCHDNGHYYMSLHAGNVGNSLSDTEYWLLIDDNIQNKRDQIETYFDADNLIDYQLINMACGDPDGFSKNWQWITYDGIKWYVCQYDKDMALGNYFTGMFTTAPRRGWINSSTSLPVGIAIKYYRVEHVNRWNELVSTGLFTAEHIKSMVTSWINTIGQENFEKEWKKWPESPCNRDSLIDFDNWIFTGSYLINSVPSSGIWDSSVNYLEEDEVWLNSFDGIYDNKFFLKFKAVQANTNKCPLTSMYSAYPKTMGYRDSAWRYYKYIEETIFNQNDFINNLL